MTGGAFGRCTGYTGYGRSAGFGRGFGRGLGMGRGMGFARRRFYAPSYAPAKYAQAYEPYANQQCKEDETKFLEDEASTLESELTEIKKRLEELKGGE